MRPGRAAAGLGILAAMLAGCGGGGEPETMSVALSTAPDSLDPAMAVTVPAVESLWLVYTPLLTYRHAEGTAGTQLIPGLARSLPKISADGRTYRLRLRPDLRYSDGTPVRAGDFEHTIKRVLFLNSPGAPFFTGIVGAEAFLKARDPAKDIPGIRTDDRTGEITIHLLAPDATFANVLATDFAGLVPGDTPMRALDREPPAGVGSYAIDAVSHGTNRFVLRRNDRFRLPGVPQAKIPRIEVHVEHNLATQAENVSRGKLDFMEEPPPPGLLDAIRRDHRDRFREYSIPGTTFLFLNQRIAPFDRPVARRAVNFAISRAAVAKLYGGLLEPSCTYLPPQIAGYDAAEPCPYGDPEGPGDIGRARRMIAEAGLAGSRVDVWGTTEGNAREAAIYAADVLDRIGFDAHPKLVDFSAYIQLIGNQQTQAQIGMVEAYEDFPHPADFFSSFDGNTITPVNNLNFGNVDDPFINREYEALKEDADLEATTPRWARLDRKLVDDADLVMLGHVKRTTFLSDRMDFDNCSVVSPVYENDYSSFCFK